MAITVNFDIPNAQRAYVDDRDGNTVKTVTKVIDPIKVERRIQMEC